MSEPNWKARVIYQPDEAKRRDAFVKELFNDLLQFSYIKELLSESDQQQVAMALNCAYTGGRVDYAIHNAPVEPLPELNPQNSPCDGCPNGLDDCYPDLEHTCSRRPKETDEN
jgi:hypothetical protein